MDYYKYEFLPEDEANNLFNILVSRVKWQDTLTNDKGEAVKIKRKMAYLAEEGVQVYRYASLSFPAEQWSDYPELLDLNRRLSYVLEHPFNSVLLNYYENGKNQIGWHSDKEESLGDKPVIACVNLGATRKFWFRKKEPNSEKVFIPVSNGDLLVMYENCQKNYLHAILREPNVSEPRVSLTFRYNQLGRE